MNLNSSMNIGHSNCAVYTDLFHPVEWLLENSEIGRRLYW